MVQSRIVFVASLIANAVAAGSASAQTAFWTNAASGAFTDPANWTKGLLPNATTPAVFGGFGAGTPFDVTFTSPAESEGLRVTNQRPVFHLAGNTYSVLGGQATVVIGGQDEPATFPSLTLASGSLTTGNCDIGVGSSTRGELVLVQGATLTCASPRIGSASSSGALSLDQGSTFRVTAFPVIGDVNSNATISLDHASRLVFDRSGPYWLSRSGSTTSVSVSGGSSVSFAPNSFLRLADGNGAVASLTLTDPGTTLGTPGEITVGVMGGVGSVSVSNGARLSAQRLLFAPLSNGLSSGTLTISGNESRVVWTQDFRVGTPNDVTLLALVEMYDGARLVGPLSGPVATFERTSQFRGVGIIEHGVRFLGSATVSASPTDLVPGTLTLLGRYESSPASIVRIPVAGTTPGAHYSQIVVANNCNPQGTVELIPVNGFAFTAGQTFEIFRYANGGGNILNVTSPALNRFRVNFMQNAVVVTVFCPGDWNIDNAVNSQDFFAFLTSFFANTADFNRDGTTNTQDFFDFIAAFLAPC